MRSPEVRPVQTRVRWLGIPEAAAILGIDDVNLRRACERNARRAPDGVVESNFDGIRARKLGRLWRVQLGGRWLTGDDAQVG
jgi:hypothetical protein